MPIYTGVADANGDFNISFGSSNYTSGEKITVTAEKDNAEKSIELHAPSSVVGGGFIQYDGNLTNFPQNIGNVAISNEITGNLPNYCFFSTPVANQPNIFSSATGLTIPATITGFGSNCFANWFRATYLDIQSSPSSIPSSCFDTWTQCLELVLPNSVTSIGDYAFRSWSNAESLTLPVNLTSIGQYAFLNWSKCATALVLPNSVTSIGQSAFSGWATATTLTLPASLTSIPNNCFYSWKKGLSIEIPNSVTSIGQNTFSGWATCTSVKIGSGVTSMGTNAFQGLTSCDVLECYAITPPTIASNTFAGLKSTCIIKVPSGSVAAYQAAANWSAFSARIQAI